MTTGNTWVNDREHGVDGRERRRTTGNMDER